MSSSRSFEMYDVNELPQYTHDCDECTFIGTFHRFDLYVHLYEEEHSVINALIARAGNEGSNYKSVPIIAMDKMPEHLLWVIPSEIRVAYSRFCELYDHEPVSDENSEEEE